MPRKIETAEFIDFTTVVDPQEKTKVEINIYRDSKTGCYFGIDTSWLMDNDDAQLFPTPFGHSVEIEESD